MALIIPAGSPVWSRSNTFETYGGDFDKVASTKEGDVPYAWKWYRLIVDLMGNAYAPEAEGTLVHARRFATARLYAYAFSRLPEQQVANSTPLRASVKLPYWVQILGIRVLNDDSEADIRRKCVTRYRAPLGPTQGNIDDRLKEILGDLYVATIRNIDGDLTTTPPQHFWHFGDPGPPSFDLGGGTWSSSISHIGVIVKDPQASELDAFLRLMNTEFYDFMDGTLPAWATFNWATTSDDTIGGVGFELDIDQLDIAGLS